MIISERKPFTNEELDFIRKVYGYGKYCEYKVYSTEITFEDHVNIAEAEKQYLPLSMIASAETTWDWQRKNDEILFIACTRENSTMVGHLSAFPIKPDLAQALCNHSVKDTEFTAEDIQYYYSFLENALYISVVCVDRKHRGLVTDLLFKELIKLIRKKIKIGCKFTEVIAEACTSEGESLLRKIGFEKLDPELPAMFRISTEEFLENVNSWLHARAKSRAFELKTQG